MAAEARSDGAERRDAPDATGAATLSKWDRVASAIVWLAYSVAMLWLLRALLYLNTVASDAQLLIAAAGCAATHLLLVLAHEVGHALAATQRGLTLVSMRVGPFEGLRQRRGWRVRWKRRPQGAAAGAVICYPSTGCDLTRAMRVCVLGGPLANVALAAAVWVCSRGVDSPPWREALVAVAWLSAVLGAANLIPYRVSPSQGTDGDTLRRLAAGIPADDPDFAALRILGHLHEGQPAGAVPEADLAALEAVVDDRRFLAGLVRLDQAWERDDADGVAAVIADNESRLRDLPPSRRAMLTPLIEGMRCAAATCAAIAARDPKPLDAVVIGEDLHWYAPYLRPRLDALRAALAHDAPRMEAQCGLAMRLAGNSGSRGVRLGEAALHARIRALVATAAGSAQWQK